MEEIGMKNKFLLVMVTLLLGFALIPAAKSEAAEFGAEISLYGEGETSLYAGGAVTGLTQTDIGSNSATISWDATPGAMGYLIYGYSSTTDSVYYITQATTSTAVLPGSNIVDQQIIVIPYDAEDENHVAGSSFWGTIKVSTLPKKVTGLQYYQPFAKTNNLMVQWTDEASLGFEATCYNKKGKVVQTVDTTDYHAVEFSKTNTKNVYTVVVKAYVVINGSEKKYGPASAKFYAVPQPQFTSTNSDVHVNSVKLKWKKVKGATSYTIYGSKKVSSGYKKIATVKGTSYTVTKVNKKSINTLKSYYYFKVITNAKFGKKTKKSKNEYYISAHSYYQ
jgi:hypothetical protein